MWLKAADATGLAITKNLFLLALNTLMMTFLLFAAMEEIIKMVVVGIVDKKTTLINYEG